MALASLSTLVLACDPEPFASVALSLRAPEGDTTRMHPPDCDGASPACLQLARLLDGGEVERLSLSNEYWGPTSPLPLGSTARTLALELFTGSGAEPVHLGRADPVAIPALRDAGGDVSFTRTALLGSFNQVEPWFESVPGPEANGAACADEAGNAWFLGESTWAFPSDTLAPRPIDGFTATVGTSLACAGRAELPEGAARVDAAAEPVSGRFYAFVGLCGLGGGGSLRTGTTAQDDSAPLELGSGCSPRVAVGEGAVWIVQGDMVTVHDPVTLARRASGAVTPPRTFRDAIVLDDGDLLAAVSTGGTLRFAAGTGTVVVSEPGPSLQVVRYLRREGAVFALTTAKVLVAADGSDTTPRDLALPELLEVRDAAVLRDGTVVALGTAEDDEGVAFDAVAVEGAARAIALPEGRDRSALTVTVGGAVLLWGGAGGVDVLVPSAPTPLAGR